MLCMMVCVMFCDVMSGSVDVGVVDVGQVEWLILCCFGVLLSDRQTDRLTNERTDICTSRVAFVTEKEKCLDL